MPKKSRRSHVPTESRKRKVRRSGPGPSVAPEQEPFEEPEDGEAPIFGDPPVANIPGRIEGPVETRPYAMDPRRTRRRLESVRSSREGTMVRTLPGQLPVFERSYLVRELRSIAFTAGALLATIIVLTIILR